MNNGNDDLNVVSRPGDDYFIRQVQVKKGVRDRAITEADVAETFGPHWRLIRRAVRQATAMTPEQMKRVFVARQAIPPNEWEEAEYGIGLSGLYACRSSAWDAAYDVALDVVPCGSDFQRTGFRWSIAYEVATATITLLVIHDLVPAAVVEKLLGPWTSAFGDPRIESDDAPRYRGGVLDLGVRVADALLTLDACRESLCAAATYFASPGGGEAADTRLKISSHEYDDAREAWRIAVEDFDSAYAAAPRPPIVKVGSQSPVVVVTLSEVGDGHALTWAIPGADQGVMESTRGDRATAFSWFKRISRCFGNKFLPGQSYVLLTLQEFTAIASEVGATNECASTVA